MSQSLSDVLIHLVFSTKNRFPFLADSTVRERMHGELGGTSNTLKCPVLLVGGVEDHVRLLARQARTISLADWIKELKRATSVWAKDHAPNLTAFAWQAGYGAFSVSHSQLERVRSYIRNQEAHHRTVDFETEFREILQRHEIEYDERFVWD